MNCAATIISRASSGVGAAAGAGNGADDGAASGNAVLAACAGALEAALAGTLEAAGRPRLRTRGDAETVKRRILVARICVVRGSRKTMLGDGCGVRFIVGSGEGRARLYTVTGNGDEPTRSAGA